MPEHWPDPRGSTRACAIAPAISSHPRPRPSTPAALPYSQSPARPLHQAQEALLPSLCRHGSRLGPPKLERTRAPPSLLPPLVDRDHSGDHPHALFLSPEPLWPRVPSPPEAPSTGVLAARNPALLEVRSVLERVGLVALSMWVGRAPSTVAGSASARHRSRALALLQMR